MKFSLILTTLFLLIGCDRGPDLDTLKTELNLRLNEAQEQLKKLKADQLDTMAIEEVEKLFIFEYKVVEFDPKISASDLEAKLIPLGQDRWECQTATIASSEFLRLICRRRPKTYLRYVPRFF